MRTINRDLDELGAELALRLSRHVADGADGRMLEEERAQLVQRGLSLAEVNEVFEAARDALQAQVAAMERPH